MGQVLHGRVVVKSAFTGITVGDIRDRELELYDLSSTFQDFGFAWLTSMKGSA